MDELKNNPAQPPDAPGGPKYHDWREDEREGHLRPGPIIVTNGIATLATYDATWLPDLAISDLTEACRQQAYGGKDLAVWRNVYLLAIVRQDPDCGPAVTSFV